MLIDLFQFVFPKDGWTGVLTAARYGFADIVRELITTYGCDRNAVIGVSWACLESCKVAVPLCLIMCHDLWSLTGCRVV